MTARLLLSTRMGPPSFNLPRRCRSAVHSTSARMAACFTFPLERTVTAELDGWYLSIRSHHNLPAHFPAHLRQWRLPTAGCGAPEDLLWILRALSTTPLATVPMDRRVRRACGASRC